MAERPRLSPRALEGLQRLQHNTDFVAFREHLEAELAYYKDKLVFESEDTPFGQVQGRARQLTDILKHCKLAP